MKTEYLKPLGEYQSHICVMWILDGEEIKNEATEIFESIKAKNFLKLMKNIQTDPRSSENISEINTHTHTPTHTHTHVNIFKILKN